MEEIETVKEHCKHPNCVYRQKLRDCGEPCCMYAAMENEPRGCKISECTRYKDGKIVKPRLIKSDMYIIWEREYYDSADDYFVP